MGRERETTFGASPRRTPIQEPSVGLLRNDGPTRRDDQTRKSTSGCAHWHRDYHSPPAGLSTFSPATHPRPLRKSKFAAIAGLPGSSIKPALDAS